jgi:hypothetical protein
VLESGVLGGLGWPEFLVLSGFWFFVPLFVLWKFYRVLAGINENLAGIRRKMESTTFRAAGG